MNPTSTKLRLIFLPFLALAICFIACYTFLHFILFIEFEALSINEHIVCLWLPILLPFLAALIWLRPRLKLFAFEREDSRFGYTVFASLFVAIPTLFAQSYLVTASGKLTALNNISELPLKQKTKYYTLKQAYIDKAHASIHNKSVIGGKHNEYLTFYFYVVMPISIWSNDTVGKVPVWMGVRYSKQIQSSISDDKKESEYHAFAEKTAKDFADLNPSQYVYLERLGNTNDVEGFNKAIESSSRHFAGTPVVLLPVNEPFDQRNGHKLLYTFISLGVVMLVWLVMILIPQLNEAKVKAYLSGKPEREDLMDYVRIFIPKTGHFATSIILDLNVLVFLIMMFAGLGVVSFQGEDLLRYGANYRPSTVNGEWWRLLTSIFLHGGLMHLAANMVGLIFIGMFLEPMLGTKWYALIYLITGIIASIASIWWHPATVSVGASGAIFGLFGAFLALLLTRLFPSDIKKGMIIPIGIYIGFNLLMGLAGGIDNAAHIGGLVSGFIMGFAFYPLAKKRIREKAAAIGIGEEM